MNAHADIKQHFIDADPYPWPYNGDLRPDNTALIIIAMIMNRAANSPVGCNRSCNAFGSPEVSPVTIGIAGRLRSAQKV